MNILGLCTIPFSPLDRFAMSDEVRYLQSLKSVRDRCSQVFALAEKNELEYWDVDLTKEKTIVDFTCDLITVNPGCSKCLSRQASKLDLLLRNSATLAPTMRAYAHMDAGAISWLETRTGSSLCWIAGPTSRSIPSSKQEDS